MITLTALAARIDTVYAAHRDSLVDAQEAELALLDAQETQKDAENSILVSFAGHEKDLGANAEARAAAVAARIPNETSAVKNAQRARLIAQGRLKLTGLDLERERAVMRIVELSATAVVDL